MSIAITELYRLLFGKSKLLSGDVISMAEHGRAGGVSTGQPFKFIDSVNYAIKITEDGTDIYIGMAVPGSVEGDPVWRAMKLDTASGLLLTYADGNPNFDNEATDLTSLSYS